MEEAGEFVAAEQQGLKGLSLAPDDAWGLHAVAHVFDMTAPPLHPEVVALSNWMECPSDRLSIRVSLNNH